MKKLDKISTEDEMQEWLEELENADGILPDGDYRWWQCPDCYNQGHHTGYHYRTMLRTTIEIDGTLAFALRDLVVEKDNNCEHFNALTHNLHNIWLSLNTTKFDFDTWRDLHVEPWQLIKAACLTLKETDKNSEEEDICV